ncbi:Hypothetical predicted protein [Podarcis lilfordi]|uniref:Uncharacterized protein n=1 Tax=Podarcis lilfordi TaxID=74358 RepID=A0AA35PAD7_9SAUR|nr:Hypothetical predicted protein [Podarcis lilfordi]
MLHTSDLYWQNKLLLSISHHYILEKTLPVLQSKTVPGRGKQPRGRNYSESGTEPSRRHHGTFQV